MATKKRISNLLQEEAQKGTSSEGEITIDTNATPVPSSVESDSPSDEETALLTNVDEEKIPAVEHTTTKRINPTKADLEATVEELRETLTRSQQNEADLLQQIEELQSNLAKQKALAEKASKELVEAKKVALQLAESNTQLTEEINALNKPQNIQPTKSHQQTQNIQPTKSPQQTQNIQPTKSHQQTQNIQPTKSHQQTQNIQPTKSPQPTKNYQPTSYKKSYRPVEPLPEKSIDESGENSSPMWLLD